MVPPPSPLDPNGRISRRDLTLNRQVWLTYGLMFGILAVCTAGIPILWTRFPLVRLELFAALLAAVSAAALVVRPPAIDTWQNHVVIVSVSVLTALGVIVFAPVGVVPVPAAMFAGTFTAGRLQDRRQLVAHYAIAGALLALPLLVVDLDGTATLGVLSMIPAVWVLGLCSVLILEAAESQGDELEQLVRRDPLTGVGNRRLLTERLTYEFDRHSRGSRSLAVIALDLNGFKALNDTVGHEAGDVLLQQVASALAHAVGPSDLVVRQGGDEFCVVLPDTALDQAENMRDRLRDALASLRTEVGTPVSGGMGIAMFPGDADTPTALLDAADGKLALDKPSSRRAAADASPARPMLAVAARSVSTPAPRVGGQFTRVSRREIAVNRFVWLATGLMVALYGFATVAVCIVNGKDGPGPIAFCVAVLGVAAVTLLKEPPPIRSWLNHVVIAIPYVGSAAFALVLPEFVGAMLGALAFVGPLAAVRQVDRRAIVGHYVVASAMIFAVIGSGTVELPVALSLLLMVLVIWAMGFGDCVYLEAAEYQGAELERLVRRDPLTGVGNRRLLTEQLDHEIRRHGRTRRPLTILALDLNGFKALNDEVGHAAGDELLRDVALALRGIARVDDTVVRQGGDEFCVLLPDTSPEQAVPIANAIRAAVIGLGGAEHPVSTGVGIATCPADATTADVLLHVGDWRLREDKQRSGTNRRHDDSDERPSPRSPLQRLQ